VERRVTLNNRLPELDHGNYFTMTKVASDTRVIVAIVSELTTAHRPNNNQKSMLPLIFE
jgi:hypothetical protein